MTNYAIKATTTYEDGHQGVQFYSIAFRRWVSDPADSYHPATLLDDLEGDYAKRVMASAKRSLKGWSNTIFTFGEVVNVPKEGSMAQQRKERKEAKEDWKRKMGI